MRVGVWGVAVWWALAGWAQAQDDGHSHGSDRRENAKIAVPEYVRVSDAVAVGTTIRLVFEEVNHSHPHVTYYAFLGESEGSWFLEYVDPSLGELRHVNPRLRGVTLALEVRKADGRVLRAWSGRPKEDELTVHEVAAPPEVAPTSQPASRPTSQPASRPTSQPASRPTSQPASRPTSQPASRPTSQPSGEVRELTVKAGTFRARETLQGGMTWWIGTEGPTRGALIKAEHSELVRVGEPETLDLGARTVEVIRLDYSGSSTTWVTDDPLVATFVPLLHSGRGVVRVRAPGFQTRLERVGDDAQPTLPWPPGVLPPR